MRELTDEHRDLWWDSPTVELAQVIQIPLPEGFTAVYGGKLDSIQVSYESWGRLNETKDNVVLIVHPMTADCHATGAFAEQPDGWWEPLIGPGRAINTDENFVVCPNLLGGCYGTTGPRFPAPDGTPFYDRFPLLTPLDMMRVQRLFLQALGIERLRLVIGPSMGGMLAWEWAIDAPDAVDQIAVVAAPLRTTAHQIGMNWLQRRGIELDITENEVVAKWGQMVARGVGMLSYRSPVGLEEKFGREWFTPPGSTLKERGMFNIESWLRHHGRRIAKRFDPYTYLLYSRAMDLHDVTQNRGNLVAALDRIRCRTLVVGISTDNLYPPEDIHFAADLLDHLGHDVRYEEIRSSNGHDAFLLDTDQLDVFLRDLKNGRRKGVQRRPRLMQRRVQVGILGAGRVAASFVRLLQERHSHLVDNHGLEVRVAAVAEIDRDKSLDPAFEGIEITYDPEAMVQRPDLDVVVDLTRGDGARPLVEETLTRGRPVVTPNKVLICAHGRRLTELALEHGTRLAYHDSIAAGWPLIYALDRSLPREEISAMRGVLSSSCNVMLERMSEGVAYEAALAEAVSRDLVEPDTNLDVSGWETAQKLTILLARALHLRVAVEDVEVRGIKDLEPDLVRRASERGFRVKLVALAQVENGSLAACVRPMAVPEEGHLGSVRGANHVVVLTTRGAGEMVYLDSGSGTLPVATAVLNDIIGLFDQERSWTGRFPPPTGRMTTPVFDQFLVLTQGRIRVVESEASGSVPVLDMFHQ